MLQQDITRTNFPVTEPHLPQGHRQHTTPAAIEMRELVQQFGENRAVNSLTLRVKQGEIFGLLGPNGSGKTTTINMISGLAVPTSGMIHVLGYDMRVPNQARQVKKVLGCVSQETALYEELSPWDNMRVHAALYGVPRRQRQERITAMLRLVELYEKRNALVKTFSGGMKRRLALARAMLHQPRVLYLDEPTLGVDVQNRNALYDFILQLPPQGVTVLLTTNDMSEAERLCTRVAILDHGTLRAMGPPHSLLKQSVQLEIRLDAPLQDATLEQQLAALQGVEAVKRERERLFITVKEGQEPLDAVLTLIRQCGRSVRQIDTHRVTLEDAFLTITGKLLRD